MDRDDDALSWDGDIRDPTHVDGPRQEASTAKAGSDRPMRTTDAAADGSAPGDQSSGSVMLVIYGALGAAYLLFTIGWVLAVTREGISLPNPFFDFMFRVGGWLAIVAPAAWFGLTFLLTRARLGRRGVAVRLLWLAIGLLLVAPWPFIVGGSV